MRLHDLAAASVLLLASVPAHAEEGCGTPETCERALPDGTPVDVGQGWCRHYYELYGIDSVGDYFEHHNYGCQIPLVVHDPDGDGWLTATVFLVPYGEEPPDRTVQVSVACDLCVDEYAIEQGTDLDCDGVGDQCDRTRATSARTTPIRTSAIGTGMAWGTPVIAAPTIRAAPARLRRAWRARRVAAPATRSRGGSSVCFPRCCLCGDGVAGRGDPRGNDTG